MLKAVKHQEEVNCRKEKFGCMTPGQNGSYLEIKGPFTYLGNFMVN